MFILRLGLCLSLLLLSLASSIAQSDFRSGYIVTISRDTLQGFVDNRTESKNARHIYFKPAQSSQTDRYEPIDLLAYGFTGSKMYESKRVKLDSTTTVVAFLELLVKGKMTLYHFKSDDLFYIEKDGQEITALYQTKTKVLHEGKSYFEIKKNYVGILRNLMSDCPAVQKAIGSTKLEYSSLMELVDDYNYCGIERKTLQTKRKFFIIKKGVLVGGQSTTIRFTSIVRDYDYLTWTDFPADLQPFGGIFVNSTFPWITEKVSLQVEAQFLRAYYYSDTQQKQRNGNIIHNKLAIDLSYLRLPILLRYTYPKGKFRPFFQAGILSDFVLNKKVHFISETHWNQSVHTTESSEMNMSKLYIYGTLGAGVAHQFSKKLWWSMEVRGAMGSSMGDPSITARYKAQTNIVALQTAIGF